MKILQNLWGQGGTHEKRHFMSSPLFPPSTELVCAGNISFLPNFRVSSLHTVARADTGGFPCNLDLSICRQSFSSSPSHSLPILFACLATHGPTKVPQRERPHLCPVMAARLVSRNSAPTGRLIRSRENEKS